MVSMPRASTPLPVLVFDGDCAICSTLARFVERRVRRAPGDFTVAPWQELDLAALGLSEEQCIEALQWVARNGQVSSAQNAVARTLWTGHVWWRPFAAVIWVPGINQLAAVIYRWVANNRHRLPGGTPACSMPPTQRDAAHG